MVALEQISRSAGLRICSEALKGDINSTVQVCLNQAKSFVPLDRCYLAPLRYLFTNTLILHLPESLLLNKRCLQIGP